MKNYADIYNSPNDSISLDQRFYLKEEVNRGVLAYPGDSDFFLHLPGGSITYEQPFESSPQRSGRHNNNIIKKKKSTAFSLSTYFNIDTLLGAAAVTEIDPALRVLWKSLMGVEDISGGSPVYTVGTPSITFSLYEVGDKWARQSPGCFVQGGNVQLVGDGEATVEWSGNGKTTFFTGLAKSTVSNDGGNTVTCEVGEGDRFRAGSAVMLILSDGLTRSTDTPAGSPRNVVSITGDVVTVDGAPLADADGSLTPVYLVYYEPAMPTGIDDPQTGLQGSIVVAGLPSLCFRSLGINIQNNNEMKDYCYGTDALAGTLFIPGDRLTAEITLGMNLTADIVEFFNRVQDFEGQNITAILGAGASRYAQFEIPRAIFQVPGFSVPDTGSIPVEFSGVAYQTAFDAADELTVSYL